MRGTVAHFRIPVLEYRWNKISSSPTHDPAEAGYDEGKCPLTLFQVNFPDSYSRINLHFRVLKYVSQKYIIIFEYKRLPLIIFQTTRKFSYSGLCRSFPRKREMPLFLQSLQESSFVRNNSQRRFQALSKRRRCASHQNRSPQ